MPYEYQEHSSNYEVPKTSIVRKVTECILLILSIAVGIYLLLTLKIIQYAAGVVLAGAFIPLCLFFCTSVMDSLIQRRDNAKK